VIYTPSATGLRTGTWVSSMSKETISSGQAGTPSSGALTTDLAHIVRIVIPTDTVIRRFYWANGSTAATNTVQVGLYRDDLTSFLLGTATVASGTNQLQFDNVTDTAMPAGRYWMAIVTNGASATIMRLTALHNHGSAWYSMAAARPLPATLVPAQAAITANVVSPMFGFTSIA
jgi:hypothetical protein